MFRNFSKENVDALRLIVAKRYEGHLAAKPRSNYPKKFSYGDHGMI